MHIFLHGVHMQLEISHRIHWCRRYQSPPSRSLLGVSHEMCAGFLSPKKHLEHPQVNIENRTPLTKGSSGPSMCIWMRCCGLKDLDQ